MGTPRITPSSTFSLEPLLSRLPGDVPSDLVKSLRHISRGHDPEFAAEQLYTLAQVSSRRGRADVAAPIYSYVAEGNFFHSEAAKAELEVLLGGGSWGQRLESFGRDFFRHTSDLGMIGGMATGMSLFQGVRAFRLSQLLFAPRAAFWTRGFGAYLQASALGFSAEVPGFVLASKGIHQALGKKVDWSPYALGQEGFFLGMNLLLLKGFGWGGERVGRNVFPGQGVLSQISRTALAQSSMVAGVYAGLSLESGEANLTDALLFSLQYQMSGLITQRLMGERWVGMVREWGMRAHVFKEGKRGRGEEGKKRWGEWGRGGMGEGGRSLVFAEGGAGGEIAPLHQAFSVGKGGGSDREFLPERLGEVLAEKFNIPKEDGALQKIVEHFSQVPQGDREVYFHRLTKGQWFDLIPLDDSPFHRVRPVDCLATVMEIFLHVTQMDTFHRVQGSFYDYLLQVALEQTMARGDVRTFEYLARTVAFHRSIPALTHFMERSGIHRGFQFFKIPNWGFQKTLRAAATTIRSLPLDQRSKQILEKYLAGEILEASLHGNHIHLPGRTPVTMSGKLALQVMEKVSREWASDLDSMQLLESVLVKSERSPVPFLYLDRLFKILATGDYGEKIALTPKLAELAWDEPFVWSKLWEIFSRRKHDLPFIAQHLNGSVYTGYIRDFPLALRLAQFYEDVRALSNPLELSFRRRNFRRMVRHYLQEGGGSLRREQILNLLHYHPTPLAAAARDAIQRRKVDFKVVDAAQMRAYSSSPSQHYKALFVTPEMRGPVDGGGKPLLAVLEMDPQGQSSEALVAQAVRLPAYLLHEFSHYARDYREGERQVFESEGRQLVGEMLALIEEQHFLLSQGERAEWERAQLDPFGYPTYLRSLVERYYFKGPRRIIVDP